MEQRPLYETRAGSGIGSDIRYFGGLGQSGRPLAAGERDDLLAAIDAATNYYVCLLRLPMATNRVGPDGSSALFWYDFGNSHGGGRGVFALQPGQPGFSGIALNSRVVATVDDDAEHTVAHEAWHTVQAELFAGRYSPHWVLEGQADGLALHAQELAGRVDHRAKLRRLARSTDVRWFIRTAGARLYDRTLAIDMDPASYPNTPAEMRHPVYREPDTAYYFNDRAEGEVGGLASWPQPVFRRGLAWRGGYQTQSFWHWLARQRGGDLAINSVMLTSVPGNAEADWVTWLDRGLRGGGWPGGLAEAYGHFIAEFADLPERYVHSRRGQLAFPVWESLIWADGCARVTLRPEYGESTHTLRLRVNPLAARCIHLKVEGSEPVAAGTNSVLRPGGGASAAAALLTPPIVGVHANVVGGGERCAAAAQLGLGSRGRHLLSIPRPEPGAGAQARRVCDRQWNVTYAPLTMPANPETPAAGLAHRGGQMTDGWQTIVLSNVGPNDPAATAELTVEVFFSLQFSNLVADGSATPPPQDAASRPAPRRIPRGQPRQGPTATPPAPVRHQDPAEAGTCTAAERALITCGPFTRITLAGGPAADLIAASGMTSLGGTMGGITGDFGVTQLDGLTPDPMDATRIAHQLAAMEAFQAAALSGAAAGAAPEGVTVEILMPRLPPGFTGVVEPVAVQVSWNDGREGGTLESRGPTGLQRAGVYPPRGRLEITANSPGAGMAGRFEAPLFEDRNPEGSPGALQAMPPLTQVARIAGSFGTPPVFVADESDKTELDEDFFRAWPRWWETMPRPLRGMAMAAGWGQAPGPGSAAAAPPAAAPASGAASAPVGCDCTCGARAALSAGLRLACQPQCRAGWAACPRP